MPHTPDAIEIHPCTVVSTDSDGREVLEQCDEDDPNIKCWSLYFHETGTGLIHVKDFDTKQEAEHGAVLLKIFMEAMGYSV